MPKKLDRFDEAVFVTASSLADEMVANSSAKVLGKDKYEFIHRAKNKIRSELLGIQYKNEVFSIGVSRGHPDPTLVEILKFNPELVKYFPENIRIVINPSEDYSTTLIKGGINDACFTNHRLS